MGHSDILRALAGWTWVIFSALTVAKADVGTVETGGMPWEPKVSDGRDHIFCNSLLGSPVTS